MKKNVIKRSFMLLIMSAMLILGVSTISYADSAVIDLNDLDTIQQVTPTPTPSATKATSTPTPTPTPNKSKTLPQTGSNVEVIFVVGLGALLGVTVYMYKKAVKY